MFIHTLRAFQHLTSSKTQEGLVRIPNKGHFSTPLQSLPVNHHATFALQTCITYEPRRKIKRENDADRWIELFLIRKYYTLVGPSINGFWFVWSFFCGS